MIQRQCIDAVDAIRKTRKFPDFPKETLIHCLDLTLLNEAALSEEIVALNEKAHQYQVAATCVYQKHLPFVTATLATKRATVLNFPLGDQELTTLVREIDALVEGNLADEIDYVFPYQSFIAGNYAHAFSQAAAVITYCKRFNLTTKIILETEAFPNKQLLFNACTMLLDTGCDFLKSSTGKKIDGVSLESAFVMLKAIQDSQIACGVKFSGGIRLIHEVKNFLKLTEMVINKPIDNSWFRIGASSLLDNLISSNTV